MIVSRAATASVVIMVLVTRMCILLFQMFLIVTLTTSCAHRIMTVSISSEPSAKSRSSVLMLDCFSFPGGPMIVNFAPGIVQAFDGLGLQGFGG